MSNRLSAETLQTLQRRNFAEFFAGIGLMRMGLEHQGWSISFANDFDPLKYQMYKGHFADTDGHFALCDIFALDVENIPHVTLATASFPCKNLSLAGAQYGGEYSYGIDAKASHAFWGFKHILEFMRQDKPPIVILENVKGFLKTNQGEDLRVALEALNNLEYAVDAFIVDAVHFVPQSRQRLFVVGLLEDVFPVQDWRVDWWGLESAIRPRELVEFIVKHEHIQWNIRQLPPPPENDALLETIVEDLPEDDPFWWSSERATYLLNQMSPRHREIADGMIAGERWSYGTVFRRMRNGKSTAELRTDGIAGCLRTPSGGSAKQILFKAGYGRYFARLLTPREAARLMGAGDYNIVVPVDQALFGFGDAVCVPVIEWIASNYLNPVLEERLQKHFSEIDLQNPIARSNVVTISDEMQSKLEELYDKWRAEISGEDGKPGWGSLCAGITIIENLLKDYTLDLANHRVGAGTQLKYQGRALGNRVFKRFGVVERLNSGGFGRTSRGAPSAAGKLLDLLRPLDLEALSRAERNEILLCLQKRLVDALLPFLRRNVDAFKLEKRQTIERAFEDLLARASVASAGAIAYHLVGAALKLGSPAQFIGNGISPTADASAKGMGDFLRGNTVFHVTMAPQDAVYEQSKKNLMEDHNVCLLVPVNKVASSLARAETHGVQEQIFVWSIGSFLTHTLLQLAGFSKEGLTIQLEALFRVYNQSVTSGNGPRAPRLLMFDREEGEVFEIEGLYPAEQEENSPRSLETSVIYAHKSLFDESQVESS